MPSSSATRRLVVFLAQVFSLLERSDKGFLKALPKAHWFVHMPKACLALPVGRLLDAELRAHLLAPGPRHGGAATRLLLEHHQLRDVVRHNARSLVVNVADDQGRRKRASCLPAAPPCPPVRAPCSGDGILRISVEIDELQRLDTKPNFLGM